MTKTHSVKQPHTLQLLSRDFTLLERRIYWMVLHLLAHDPSPHAGLPQQQYRTFRFHVSALFVNQHSARHINTQRIRKALCRITARELEISLNGSLLALVPFPLAFYHNGYIQLEMAARAVPYFVNLSGGYAQFTFDSAISLLSGYAQLLYPILCRFLDKGFWRVEVDQLRTLLHAETYVRYANFRQRVIGRALQEIDRKTDVQVSCQEQREGRFVRWLQFSIRRRHGRESQFQAFRQEVETALQLPLEQRRMQVQDLFRYYRLTKAQQRQILEDEAKLNAFVQAESYVAQGVGDITDPTAYIAVSVFGKKAKSGVKSEPAASNGL